MRFLNFWRGPKGTWCYKIFCHHRIHEKTKIDEPRNVKPAGFKMLNAEEYNKSTAVVFTPHHDASLEVRARPANTSTNCRPSTLLTNSLFRNATISTMETNSYRRVFGRLAHVDIKHVEISNYMYICPSFGTPGIKISCRSSFSVAGLMAAPGWELEIG